jgi:hypothetical protein
MEREPVSRSTPAADTCTGAERLRNLQSDTFFGECCRFHLSIPLYLVRHSVYRKGHRETAILTDRLRARPLLVDADEGEQRQYLPSAEPTHGSET